MTKIKSYLKRNKYFEDSEVGNDTRYFDVCHQHQPATNNLSKTCLLRTLAKYPEAVYFLQHFNYWVLFQFLGGNDDSQIKTTNQCCCYTSNEYAESFEGQQKSSTLLVFGRYLSFKIHILSSLKDKKTFRSNILIVKSFATFSIFWYINFTIEQKRCNICHIEYIHT